MIHLRRLMLENTYQARLEVLFETATLILTIQYRDDVPATRQVSSQELAAPGASYKLP